ncbi:MAG: arylesterase [Cyclobacteriaceae bacterium]|nr:arylesterase [Cyclobacteriaceae bacterium]
MKNILVSLSLFGLIWACSPPTQQPKEVQQAVSEMLPAHKQRPVILFFGNSITAGYQLDMDDAFPAIIQDWLDSLGYNYQVVNAGLSGETSASGLARIEWVLQTVPDIFVLELGANDGLRGLPLDQTLVNLKGILQKVTAANPNVKVIVAGMEVPPNLGADYTAQFRGLYAALAQESQSSLIPFLLDGVAGNPSLNLSDGIHPTPEGHEILAQTVWQYLYPFLALPSVETTNEKSE